MATVDSAQLLGTWWRVPEQDVPGRATYRKEGTDLPPARGRQGFTLSADGQAQLHSPGPTDRRESTASQWRLDDQGRLVVDGVLNEPTTVVRVGADHLELERP